MNDRFLKEVTFDSSGVKVLEMLEYASSHENEKVCATIMISFHVQFTGKSSFMCFFKYSINFLVLRI